MVCLPKKRLRGSDSDLELRITSFNPSNVSRAISMIRQQLKQCLLPGIQGEAVIVSIEPRSVLWQDAATTTAVEHVAEQPFWRNQDDLLGQPQQLPNFYHGDLYFQHQQQQQQHHHHHQLLYQGGMSPFASSYFQPAHVPVHMMPFDFPPPPPPAADAPRLVVSQKAKEAGYSMFAPASIYMGGTAGALFRILHVYLTHTMVWYTIPRPTLA